MKKKYALIFFAFLCFSMSGIGQIYTESFTGQNGKGAVGPSPTVDISGVTWSIDISTISLTANSDWFQVVNEVFEARDIDGKGIWYSPSIDISAYTDVFFSLDASENGNMESEDYFHTEYRIDGGIWSRAANNGTLVGDFTSATVSQTGLTGNSLEIRVLIKNNAGDEYHRLDNIIVDGTPLSGNMITVTQSTGGSITPGTTNVADNANQSFTATPDACHTFSHWVVDGTAAGSANPYTFTNVTADHTITAVYTQHTYDITATAGPNGTITPTGTTTLNCGDNQSYSITADTGYAVADVLVDGVSVGAVTSYDFNNITQAHTISVTFAVYTAPCHYENFENICTSSCSPANSTYGTRSWIGDGGTWSSTSTRTDQTINGSAAITLKNGTLTSPNFSDGIGKLTMTTELPFSDSAGNLTVKVNTVVVGTIPYSTSPQTSTIPNINIGGNIIITIEETSGARVAIDDIEWSCYSPCTPPADPTGTISGATPVCATSTSLNFSDTAPSNVTYYWQNSSLGESQTNDAASNLTVTTSGDYYVRAYDNVEGCWSNDEVGPYSVFVSSSAPIIDTNPNDISAGVGGSATFSVTSANGANYQWQVSTDGGGTWSNIGTDNNSLTITNAQLADNGNLYQVIVTNACGSTTSSTATLTVTTSTIFSPGELIFVGYDGQINGSGANDEFLLATLVDITPGTEFSLVNSRYEAGAPANVRTQKWGGGSNDPSEEPFETKIQYNGTSTIPAGSVLRFNVTTTNAFLVYAYVTIGTTSTDRTAEFSANVTFPGSHANISTSGDDQLYLMQGDFTFDGTTDANEANYYFSGTLLHGITIGTPWVPLSSACSGVNGSTGRQSRLPAELRCFNVVSENSIRGYYENDKEHGLATLREIVNSVSDVAGNWNLTGYNFDPTDNTAASGGKTFNINPSNPVGQWVGDVDNNWFNCANWEGLAVPKSNTNVQIDATSLNNAVIDHTANYSNEFNDIAYTNNITISGNSVVLEGDANNVLEVHGNLILDSAGTLDMDDNNNTTPDGQLFLYGNWTNNIGEAAFNEGNGTVIFTGNNPQIINNVTPIGTEEFYNVILNNDFNTNVSNNLFMHGNLTVNSGFTATVDSNDYIHVHHSLNNNGTFNILDSGSLIQVDDAGVNTGNISMLRNTQIRRLDYVYWSSPVSGFNVNNISPGSPTSLIFRWGPTDTNANGTQGNWINAAGEIMEPGLGYIVRGPSSYTNTAAIYTAEFNNGVPFNGWITRNVSRGDISANEDDDWNLLGNPYPSAINALEFLNNTVNTAALDGFVNIWTHGTLPSSAIPDPFYEDFVYNYTSDDYITYNGTGTTNGPSGFNGYIAAGQSFMVNMNNGPAATLPVEFRNNMRDKSYDNTQFYRNGSIEKHRIWLDLAPENRPATRILVGYVENATQERDRLYDAITDTQNFYSLINNERFVIQGRALPFQDTDVVPIGVKIASPGNYTFAIAYVDGLFETENQNIYIKDKHLGYIHNISNAPYSFSIEAGEFNDRFEIVYRENALSTEENELNTGLTIIELQDGDVQFQVSNNVEIKNVKIYDVLGRLLYNLQGNRSTEVYNLNKLSQSTYIAKITLSNGIVISKKAVKR
ncbi:T9SS sorting signal type C domain-containing protein [Oceanihabitans sediminis]|uniref:T9SS sorting signal type C domain-containing protein n=1 Tax=Oceanihabitans sediminis TaxID=1812012 RepID=UPI003A8F47AC